MLEHKKPHLFFYIVVIALIMKLSLFAFAVINAPQSKIQPDSDGYLKPAAMLASKGAFATQDENGILKYEVFRTPGYPVFLAILHGLMKIPLNGVILLQIAMTLLAAFVTYKTAFEIDCKIALLSAAIILLDPPITIFSLLILTEALFLLLISLFMFNFVRYLKNRKVRFVVLSALILAAATYVRPVSYYLGFATALFIIYANRNENFKKAFTHAIIFVLIVYSFVGIWQVRNHIRCGEFAFSTVEQANLSCNGLFKSYMRNTDPYSKGMAPLPYYANVSFRCLMSLMTRPGNFKYFQSEALNVTGYIFAYPWMIFWLSGFILGAIKMRREVYVQFMLFIVLYFIVASIGGLMWGVGERLRVPMMPFIAIISAYGWRTIKERIKLFWNRAITKMYKAIARIKDWLILIAYVTLIYITLPLMPKVTALFSSLLGRHFGTIANLLLIAIIIVAFVFMFKHISNRKSPLFYIAVVMLFASYLAILFLATPIVAEKMHLLEYGVLSYLALRAVKSVKSRKRRDLCIILIVILVGSCDELIQKFLPNRYYELRDMVLNIISGILGLFVLKLLKPKYY